MNKQQNPQDLWYLQNDVVRLGRKNRQDRIKHKDTAVNIGLESLDEIFLPLLFGELMTIIARPGGGKCLGKGTKVLMYNGTFKQVENIKNGDLLMGADSKSRKVLSTATGKEKMYWIKQNYGVDYRVNESHILSLKRSKNEYNLRHGEVINISVKDIVENKGKSFLARWKGYKTPVDFPYRNVTIDPYFLGLWLGDGKSNGGCVYTTDDEVINFLQQYARERNEHVSIGDKSRPCKSYLITKGYGYSHEKTSIQAELRKLNLLNNKHIPDDYLYNSREVRMKLLAGLIDSDGYMNKNESYSITLINKQLLQQIKFLCDSLGLRTGKNGIRYKKTKTQNGTMGDAWRLSFNGDLTDCPIQIVRKIKTKKSNIDLTMSGIKIEADIVDDYYGFTLDGDGLFLLEDMTVTHNTGFCLRWARERAKYLMEHDKDRIVIYASCEQTIEELDNLGAAAESGIPLDKMARGQIDDNEWLILNKADTKRGGMRIAWIGKSYENRKKRPKITPNTITECIFDIEEKTGLKADICFVDYLQLLKSDSNIRDKQERVTDILESAKDNAMSTCAWVVNCQAKREVDAQRIQIPGLDSGQWTSGIEQFSDKVASLVRPSKYRKQGEKFGDIEVRGHSQMLFTLLKQKLGKDNIAKWVYFDPAYNKLHELESKYAIGD